ncbi:unnamed protein product, partial [Trichogramma brassicae]
KRAAELEDINIYIHENHIRVRHSSRRCSCHESAIIFRHRADLLHTPLLPHIYLPLHCYILLKKEREPETILYLLMFVLAPMRSSYVLLPPYTRVSDLRGSLFEAFLPYTRFLSSVYADLKSNSELTLPEPEESLEKHFHTFTVKKIVNVLEELIAQVVAEDPILTFSIYFKHIELNASRAYRAHRIMIMKLVYITWIECDFDCIDFATQFDATHNTSNERQMMFMRTMYGEIGGSVSALGGGQQQQPQQQQQQQQPQSKRPRFIYRQRSKDSAGSYDSNTSSTTTTLARTARIPFSRATVSIHAARCCRPATQSCNPIACGVGSNVARACRFSVAAYARGSVAQHFRSSERSSRDDSHRLSLLYARFYTGTHTQEENFRHEVSDAFKMIVKRKHCKHNVSRVHWLYGDFSSHITPSPQEMCIAMYRLRVPRVRRDGEFCCSWRALCAASASSMNCFAKTCVMYQKNNCAIYLAYNREYNASHNVYKLLFQHLIFSSITIITTNGTPTRKTRIKLHDTSSRAHLPRSDMYGSDPARVDRRSCFDSECIGQECARLCSCNNSNNNNNNNNNNNSSNNVVAYIYTFNRCFSRSVETPLHAAGNTAGCTRAHRSLRYDSSVCTRVVPSPIAEVLKKEIVSIEDGRGHCCCAFAREGREMERSGARSKNARNRYCFGTAGRRLTSRVGMIRWIVGVVLELLQRLANGVGGALAASGLQSIAGVAARGHSSLSRSRQGAELADQPARKGASPARRSAVEDTARLAGARVAAQAGAKVHQAAALREGWRHQESAAGDRQVEAAHQVLHQGGQRSDLRLRAHRRDQGYGHRFVRFPGLCLIVRA